MGFGFDFSYLFCTLALPVALIDSRGKWLGSVNKWTIFPAHTCLKFKINGAPDYSMRKGHIWSWLLPRSSLFLEMSFSLTLGGQ